MQHDNLIGIDLSKHSFQGCFVDKHSTERFNRKFTRQRLIHWFARQAPLAVALEACGSAHHWARVVERLGHKAVILPPHTVTAFRLGHKTDATDARAVAVAARQPGLKPVAPKTLEQQGLQGVDRIRQHWSDHLTATGNLIRSLLNEFGLTVPKGKSRLKQRVVEVLEDAENEVPMPLRLQLIEAWHHYIEVEERLKQAKQAQDRLVAEHVACCDLMRLEGVGPVNALGLYLALGDRGSSFVNGREAAACIGLTPKQYSTGGETVMLGISKRIANKRLRSNLIQGARSVINRVRKHDPRTPKEAWLKSLMVRRGEGRAAVALANKTIRQAWAMLHYGEDFKFQAEQRI